MQGKTLLLITNSDFNYTDKLMRYTFDPYLPKGFSWRDLFDMVRTATCVYNMSSSQSFQDDSSVV